MFINQGQQMIWLFAILSFTCLFWLLAPTEDLTAEKKRLSALPTAQVSMDIHQYIRQLRKEKQAPYYRGFEYHQVLDASVDHAIEKCFQSLPVLPDAAAYPLPNHTQALTTFQTIQTTSNRMNPQNRTFYGVSFLGTSLHALQLLKQMRPPHLYGNTTCQRYVETLIPNGDPAILCQPRAGRMRRFKKQAFWKGVMLPTVVCGRLGRISHKGMVQTGSVRLQPEGYCNHGDFGMIQMDQKKEEEHAPFLNRTMFVFAQQWSDQVFHALVENGPRLAVYHQYLLAHPDIQIGMAINPFTVALMEFLGFSKDRLVSLPVNARQFLLPQPSLYCGNPLYTDLTHFRHVILHQLSLYQPEWRHQPPRNTILIIQRSRRRLLQHDELVRALQVAFPHRPIQIYSDNPPPSLAESFRLFHDAKVVIGPHGAGLANLVASRPGTVVIEYLAHRGINYCYAVLSEMLGLEYHGFVASELSDYDGDIYGNVLWTVSLLKGLGL